MVETDVQFYFLPAWILRLFTPHATYPFYSGCFFPITAKIVSFLICDELLAKSNYTLLTEHAMQLASVTNRTFK